MDRKSQIENIVVLYAGTGTTLAEASAPGYLEVNEYKLAMISITSTGGNERESILTPQTPCVNFVNVDDPVHRERVFSSIEEAKGSDADIIFIYHHWHGHDEIKVEWAHELIDRGVDIFVSQGYPEMGGIEIYKGKPLFYNLKNFIFHTRTDIGHYGNAAWENVFATMEYHNGKFIRFPQIMLQVTIWARGIFNHSTKFQLSKANMSTMNSQCIYCTLDAPVNKQKLFGKLQL